MPSAELSPYITLISSDGFEFIIRRETANVAKVLKKMLDPQSEFWSLASGFWVCSIGKGSMGARVEKYFAYGESANNKEKHKESRGKRKKRRLNITISKREQVISPKLLPAAVFYTISSTFLPFHFCVPFFHPFSYGDWRGETFPLFLHLLAYALTYCKMIKWSSTRKDLRVPILFWEISRLDFGAGHAYPSRAVPRSVDGSGLFAEWAYFRSYFYRLFCDGWDFSTGFRTLSFLLVSLLFVSGLAASFLCFLLVAWWFCFPFPFNGRLCDLLVSFKLMHKRAGWMQNPLSNSGIKFSGNQVNELS